MKKNSNSGFMLAETLIVASFISITLIYIFVQFRNINNNYSTSIAYNNVNGMYINNEIKKFISQYNMEQISLNITYSNKGYYDLSDCDPNIFTDTTYCINLFSKFNIKRSIYTTEKINVTDENMSGDFLKYLSTVNRDDSSMYIIATEFNDGTFASIRLTGFQFPTLEDVIKKQTIVQSGSGLYNDSNNDGESYVFKGNLNEINNNIKAYGYDGRVLEINNHGVKVILETIENQKFNNDSSAYSKSNSLINGAYSQNSNSDSLLLYSLNRTCRDCKGIIKDSTWNIGNITDIIGSTFDNIILEEKSIVYKGNDSIGFAGTVSVSDIIKASTNSLCDYSNISNQCLLNNWLNSNIWTLNANGIDNVWRVYNNEFISSAVDTITNSYAVLYIDKYVNASGSGTSDDPFVVL